MIVTPITVTKRLEQPSGDDGTRRVVEQLRCGKYLEWGWSMLWSTTEDRHFSYVSMGERSELVRGRYQW